MSPSTENCFDEQGNIKRDLFDSQALNVLDRMITVVNNTGSRFIGAQHFLLGLAGASPWFQQCVVNVGCDPAYVLRRFEAVLKPGKPIAKRLELVRLAFSEYSNLVLDEAWHLSENHQPRLVTDRHLLRAFIKSPESNTQRVLSEVGINLTDFEKEAQKDDPITINLLKTNQSSDGESPTDLFAASDNLNLGRFDDTSRGTLAITVEEAQKQGQLMINTAHVFLGMASVKETLLAREIAAQGFDLIKFCAALRQHMQKLPELPSPPNLDRRHLSPNVINILTIADDLSRQTDPAGLIADPHLLTGLLSLKESSTLLLVRQLGIKLEALYKIAGLDLPPQMEEAKASNHNDAPGKAHQESSLLEFGRNLTQEAASGKLDPVYGRKEEIHRLIQTLIRQKKNNAILIGAAGVGKTAIVEGLAQRIAEGKVPPQLKGKDIIEIEISSLVAGTMYRGQFEERLEKIISEAQQKQVILFIDEIHTLVGAGQSSGGMLDGGNILKPALARGQLHLIGATTPTEYSRSIEKDAALERRFQPLIVGELSTDETIRIMKELATGYEKYYKVQIQPESIHAAVLLSEKYLPQKQLPDKAIDLLEETCSKANLSIYSSASGSFQDVDTQQEIVVVTPDMVAKILSQMTGTPIASHLKEDSRMLVELESRLAQTVIGQDEAIQTISRCIQIGRAGLRSEHRPLGVMIFVGPSGVGKTWLAKMVAKELFGSDEGFFRLDMSEFTEPHSVSKLLGAPPGYVGFEEEGLLTGHLRHHPSSVVLLDEIEKAHPIIFDTLLQLFDAGRITDSQGRLANGEAAIFIMTSNLATKLTEHHMLGFIPVNPDKQDKKPVLDPDMARSALKSFFRVEFLNRIDDVVVFEPLDLRSARKIAEQRLKQVSQKAWAHGLDISFTNGCLNFIVEKGFSQEFGARNLNRVIDNFVNQPLSKLILSGDHGKFLCGTRSGQIFLTKTPESKTTPKQEDWDSDIVVNTSEPQDTPDV